MAKLERALLLFALIRRLGEPPPADVQELARHLGRDVRTVFRLLAGLRRHQIPLQAEVADARTGRKTYRIPTPLGPVLLSLDAMDAVALRVLLARARPRAGEPFHEEVSGLEAKLRQALEPCWKGLYQELEGVIAGSPAATAPAAPGAAEAAEELVNAALHHQLCEMRYLARDGEERRYPIAPQQLFRDRDGRECVAAWVPSKGELRPLLVSRFLEVRRTRQRCDPPASLDVDGWIAESFNLFHDEPIRARIRFDPQVARPVRERPGHPSQEVRDLPGGGVEVTLQAAGRAEILAWVLRYGEYAEVVEPADLREEMVRRLEAMRARYAERSEGRGSGRIGDGAWRAEPEARAGEGRGAGG